MVDPIRKKHPPPPTRALVLERERIAWEMRVECKTYREIGDALGVTTEGARQICNRAEAKAAALFDEQVGRIRARQHAQQMRIIRQATIAGDKSCEARTRVIQKENDDGEKVTTTDVVAGMLDVNYPRLILQVHEAERALCGLNIMPSENPYTKTISDLTGELDAPYKPKGQPNEGQAKTDEGRTGADTAES
jgi:hypothetical protein